MVMGKGKGKAHKSDEPCKFYARGSCRLGDECSFKHVPSTVETAVAAVAAQAVSFPTNQPTHNHRTIHHPPTQPTQKQPTNRPTKNDKLAHQPTNRPKTGQISPKRAGGTNNQSTSRSQQVVSNKTTNPHQSWRRGDRDCTPTASRSREPAPVVVAPAYQSPQQFVVGDCVVEKVATNLHAVQPTNHNTNHNQQNVIPVSCESQALQAFGRMSYSELDQCFTTLAGMLRDHPEHDPSDEVSDAAPADDSAEATCVEGFRRGDSPMHSALAEGGVSGPMTSTADQHFD